MGHKYDIYIVVFILVLILGIIAINYFFVKPKCSGNVDSPTDVSGNVLGDNVVISWTGLADLYNVYVGTTSDFNILSVKPLQTNGTVMYLSIKQFKPGSYIYVKIVSIVDECKSSPSPENSLAIPIPISTVSDISFVLANHSNGNFIYLDAGNKLCVENKFNDHITYTNDSSRWIYENGYLKSVSNPILYLSYTGTGTVKVAPFETGKTPKWTFLAENVCSGDKCLRIGNKNILDVSLEGNALVDLIPSDDYCNISVVNIDPKDDSQKIIMDDTFRKNPFTIRDIATNHVLGYNGIGVLRSYNQQHSQSIKSIQWIFDKDGRIRPLTSDLHKQPVCIGIRNGCIGADKLSSFDLINSSWVYSDKHICLKQSPSTCIMFPPDSAGIIEISPIGSKLFINPHHNK